MELMNYRTLLPLTSTEIFIISGLLDYQITLKRDFDKLCEVCQEYLRYVSAGRHRNNRVLKVWVLKDYDSGEWFLEHKFSARDFRFILAFLTMIHFQL